MPIAIPRIPTALLAALLLAALVIVAAPGDAGAIPTRAERQAELNRVMERQGDVATSIEEQNRLVDSLIGEVSQARERYEAAEARLAAKQAELDEVTAELAVAREQLEESRRRLHRSLGGLQEILIDIYRTGQPDMSAIVLSSADWSSVVAEVDYLQRINDQQNVVVERVEQLRDEAEGAVARLAEVRERIEAARDAVAADRARADAERARVQSHWDQLVAERERREQTMRELEDRQVVLEEDLEVSVPSPGESAALVDGQAIAPAGAPAEVKAAIAAANSIAHMPYLWGGGHGSFESSGYDCSGAVSYALHGGGLLGSPLDSTGLTFWGEPGVGSWITAYGNSGHVYVVIAGLRFDTSGTGGSGPRWHEDPGSPAGYIPRHPPGL